MTIQHIGTTPEAMYSPAVTAAGLVFTSGQVGVDPSIGAVPHDFAEEVETAMANLERLLESSDSGLDLVVKMTCYVADIELAPVLNEIYARRMPQPRPARATVEVRMVPPYRVEIECVAGRRR